MVTLQTGLMLAGDSIIDRIVTYSMIKEVNQIFFNFLSRENSVNL